jgi:hypothetical protein
MFTYNTARALEVLKVEIRRNRTKLFTDLDIQYIRALEAGNIELQNQITSQKEVLRNLTDISIDGVTTREELIALWPEDILGTNPFPKNS